MSDVPEYRENDRRYVGPDYRSAEHLYPIPELARSHSGRGSVFDARVPSPRVPPRDVSDDEDEDDDDNSDSDSSGRGLGSRTTPWASEAPRRESFYFHPTHLLQSRRRKEGRTVVIGRRAWLVATLSHQMTPATAEAVASAAAVRTVMAMAGTSGRRADPNLPYR